MEKAHSSKNLEVSSPRQEYLALLATFLGAGPDMPNRREYLLFFAAFFLTFIGTLSFLGYSVLEPFRQSLLQAILQPEKLRATVHHLGYWGPFFLVMAQAMQVVFMIWPAPLELASGYLFGPHWGLFYSILGIVLGSMLAFLLGRWLEKRYVSQRVGHDAMRGLRQVMKREGALAGFLIFLLPGVPKDFLCYAFGMTRMPLAFFLLMTTLARLPGTFLFTFQGAAIHKGYYGIIMVLLGMYLGVALVLYRHRQAVYQWVSRWHPEEE